MKSGNFLFYLVLGGVPIVTFNTIFLWADLPPWLNCIIGGIGLLFVLFNIFFSVLAYDLSFMFLQGLFWADVIYCISKGAVCAGHSQQNCYIALSAIAVFFNLLLPFLFQKNAYERLEKEQKSLKENFESMKAYRDALEHAYNDMKNNYSSALKAYEDIEKKHTLAVASLKEYEDAEKQREYKKEKLKNFLKRN